MHRPTEGAGEVGEREIDLRVNRRPNTKMATLKAGKEELLERRIEGSWTFLIMVR